jgi:hypothetical protein
LIDEDMNIQSFEIIKIPILKFPKKNVIWMSAMWRIKEYTIRRRVVPLPKGCGSCKAYA